MRERARITEAHGDLIVLEMLRDYFRARLRSGQSNNTRDTYLFFVAKLSVMIDKFKVSDKHLEKIKRKKMNKTQEETNELATAQIMLKDLDVKGVSGVEALKKIELYFNVWAGKTDSTEAERELCKKFGEWMKIVTSNLNTLETCVYLVDVGGIHPNEIYNVTRDFLKVINGVNK